MVASSESRPRSTPNLVHSARRGSDEAYQALYERYATKLLSRLRVMFPAEAAEDAAQEAWTTAFQKLGTLEHADAFFAWIMTIARNSARNALRQQHNSLTVPLDGHGERIVEENADPASVAEVGESQRTTRDVLGRLPQRQRAALHLRWFEELSYREIASRLALSVSAVETLIYRARSNFHRQYESIESDQPPAVLACYKVRESFAPYLADALAEPRRRRLATHLSQCSRCERTLAKMRRSQSRHVLGPVLLPLAGLRSRLIDWLHAIAKPASQLPSAAGLAAGVGAVATVSVLTGITVSGGEPGAQPSAQVDHSEATVTTGVAVSTVAEAVSFTMPDPGGVSPVTTVVPELTASGVTTIAALGTANDGGAAVLAQAEAGSQPPTADSNMGDGPVDGIVVGTLGATLELATTLVDATDATIEIVLELPQPAFTAVEGLLDAPGLDLGTVLEVLPLGHD